MLSNRDIMKLQRTVKDGDDRLPILFGALGDSRRFQMVKLLIEKKGLCVSEIAKIFGISVPAASQQLRILEMTGLLTKERCGQFTCYAIADGDPVVQTIKKTIS